MMLEQMKSFDPVVRDLAREREVVWINPKKRPYAEVSSPSAAEEIREASDRLRRFAPLIRLLFPETAAQGGIIESELTEIPAMKAFLQETAGADLGGGRLFLKRDSDLAVAGSVKARGGIYEVLRHSEELALAHGILSDREDDYTVLAGEPARALFRRCKVQVGSTGNLGVSIGIMSAALGFRAIVHMSADAAQWKKDLLRSHGVEVREYDGDYGEAVARGRAESDADPASYFVDDENSRDLFFGCSVAAERLQVQLTAKGIAVDDAHPLFVYIPCGVGGAPGGICLGLKELYGDNVHVFFAEPTRACCMILGLATGLHNRICVQDIGLSGHTHADGLAVGRPSGFVGRVIEPLLSGEVTVADAKLYDTLRALWECEHIFIEPSSCAAFQGVRCISSPEMQTYLAENGLLSSWGNASHIVWATGGKLVPGEVRAAFFQTYPE